MSEEKATSDTRLEDLEAQVEGLKTKLLVGFVLILGLAAVLAQRVYLDKRGITTNGIILADENAPRTALVLTPNGHIASVPFSFAGQLPSLQFEGVGGLKGLAFYDSQGKPRILLGVNGEDQPVMAVVGADGSLQWSPIPMPAPEQGGQAPQPGSTPAPEAAPATPAPEVTPTP
ncbi:MAG: hypothetical protein KC910_03050 [Candidatus Eremiobacteraeota bacterium]|nr:hypothetical protein [Candidatus Eremiobacteraeota bacterium]